MTEPMERLIFRRSTPRDHTASACIEETQRVLLIGHDASLADVVTPLCRALDIQVVGTVAHHDIPITLHRERPMCVVSGLEAAGTAGCNMLRSVAAYDPDLPVLLVTGDDPAIDGAIDAAEQLWGLTSVCRLSEAPGLLDVMNFLFLAGRRTDSGRLIPIS